MAYSLSFSPEFFLAEGEPCDRDSFAVNAKGEPVSVWSAIQMIPQDEWADMARELFDCKPEHLTPEMVLQRIRQVDTCGTLTVPVDVWIDSEGYYTVDVYDGPEASDEPEPEPEPEPDPCILCGGPRELLGGLGNLQHFRCRNCGAPSHEEVGGVA